MLNKYLNKNSLRCHCASQSNFSFPWIWSVPHTVLKGQERTGERGGRRPQKILKRNVFGQKNDTIPAKVNHTNFIRS